MGPNRKRVTHFSESEPVKIRLDEQLDSEKVEPEMTPREKVSQSEDSANRGRFNSPLIVFINLKKISNILAMLYFFKKRDIYNVKEICYIKWNQTPRTSIYPKRKRVMISLTVLSHIYTILFDGWKIYYVFKPWNIRFFNHWRQSDLSFLVDTCSFMISIKDIVKFRSIRSLIQKGHCQ